MRHTKTIDINLRCPKCRNPMQNVSKSKELRCIYCGFRCVKKDCMKLKDEG